MATIRSRSVLVLALCVSSSACTETRASTELDGGSPRSDATVDDAPSSPLDAGAVDGASSVDADAAASDASSTGPDGDVRDADAIDADFMNYECAVTPSGPCDGVSRLACTEWAQRVGAGWSEPNAICVVGFADGCVRADACVSIDDVTTCTCGAGPRCGLGEVCARARPGEARTCLPCHADL